MPLTSAPAPARSGPAETEDQRQRREARHQEIMALAAGPSVEEYVRELAREHGVSFQRTALDDWADTISRLSDAEVEHDEIMDLTAALTDAGILTPERSTALYAAHLIQRRA